MNDDLISRSTIKHAIYDVCLRNNNIDIFEKLLDRINELPSVNPQEPKTGHWILHPNQNEVDIENDNYMYVCSECSHADIHSKSTVVPYCWYCGAKMVEPQESEEISDRNIKMWEEIFKAESEDRE